MSTITSPVGEGQANINTDVMTVQLMLNKFLVLGVPPGIGALAADGKFGPQTKTAVVAFQKHVVGMKPDGLVMPISATMNALNGPVPTLPPQPVAPPISGNQYIRWVKGTLNRLLGSTLIDDGEKSLQYRFWVKEFQTNQTLGANGEVDETTQIAMVELNKHVPEYVAWIQRSVNKSGEGPISVTGNWDQDTIDAVKDFQINEGLKVDGRVGAKTETALYMRSGIPVPGRIKGPKPPVSPPPPKPTGWSDSLTPDLRMNVWLNAVQIDIRSSPSLYPDTPSLRWTLGVIDNLAKPGSLLSAAYVTKSDVEAYKSCECVHRGIDPTEYVSDARKDLLSQVRVFQRMGSYDAAYDRFRRQVFLLTDQIAGGLYHLKTLRKDDMDGHNACVRMMFDWGKSMQEKKWSILYPFRS